MRINIGALTLLLSAAANLGAATISYTVTDTPNVVLHTVTGTVVDGTTWYTLSNSLDESFALRQFNTALGTLNGVTIGYDYVYGLTLDTGTADPDGSAGGFVTNGTMSIGGVTFWGDGGGVNLGGLPDTQWNGGFEVKGSASEVWGNVTADQILTNLEGTGTAAYLWAQNSQVLASTGAVAQATRTSGSVTVTYDYTPAAVPEPASMALTGLGLAAVGLLRRKLR